MNLYLKKKKFLIPAPFTASYKVLRLLYFDELSPAPPAGEMKYFSGLPLLVWELLGLLYDLAACCRPSVRPSSQHFLCAVRLPGHSKVAKTHGMMERGYVWHGEMFLSSLFWNSPSLFGGIL